MTAANPNAIDARVWLKRTRAKLTTPAGPKKWTALDFKITWLLRDQFSRDELLTILDIATNKRFDRLNQIETFLTMMAGYIDGRTDDGEK